MKLNYGVTSFYDSKRGKPARVDFKIFQTLSHALARETGCKVMKVEKGGFAHNYFYALFSNEKFGFVCNAHYSLVSYVPDFWGPAFGSVLKSKKMIRY